MTRTTASPAASPPTDAASFSNPSTTVVLTGSVTMPVVGVGLYLVDAVDMTPVVHTALDRGYRLFDTASMYDSGSNETGLGAALGSSGIPRDEVFLTSKVWNDEQGADRVRNALDRSLERLRTDHLDLYLIHWPAPAKGQFIQTWETLLDLQRDGLIRAAGVANFEADHVEQLIAATGVAPAVNQIEVHPHLQQAQLLAYNASVGTVTQAWSPLARGGAILRDRTIADIAAAHRRTPGQVILRWHLQRGTAIAPKSAKPERISENIDLFSFALDDAEMGAITDLERGQRTGPDPRTFPENRPSLERPAASGRRNPFPRKALSQWSARRTTPIGFAARSSPASPPQSWVWCRCPRAATARVVMPAAAPPVPGRRAAAPRTKSPWCSPGAVWRTSTT